MIILWIKIMYYRIMRRNHAVPGTEPRAYARVTKTVDGYGISLKAELPPVPYDEARCAICDLLTDDCTCVPLVTMNPERLRDLYGRGLVYAPTEDAEMDRMRIFEQDRDRRMERAFFDAAACPCGGRHYPSADACRWCRCHDPRNEHHVTPDDVKAASDVAAWRQGRRNCPLTEDGTGCSPGTPCGAGCIVRSLLDAYEGRSIPEGRKFADTAEGPGIAWPCIGPSGMCPDWTACDEQGHCVEEPQAPIRYLSDELFGDVRTQEIEIPVRPSGEIVLCGTCPHPEHVTGDRRCTGSVPSGEPSGGIESCRCDGERILPWSTY